MARWVSATVTVTAPDPVTVSGSVTVTEDELAALEQRYGGGVAVMARRLAEGSWSFSLVPGEPGEARRRD